jgi:hypothetical protein
MYGNTGILGQRLRQLRSGVSDEVDVDAAGRQCAGVVLHPRTSSEVSDDDDSGAHA